MLPITLLAHYCHKKEASTGMVNPSSVGSGVQETCSGAYQPLQSQNRKPRQPEIAAGTAGLSQHRSSAVAAPAMHNIQLVTGQQGRPMRVPSPAAAPQGLAAEVPGAAEAGRELL